MFQHTAARRRLALKNRPEIPLFGFNTQPPEGGCPSSIRVPGRYIVSTHSRPKAAGGNSRRRLGRNHVSTHSRPKAADRPL